MGLVPYHFFQAQTHAPYVLARDPVPQVETMAMKREGHHCLLNRAAARVALGKHGAAIEDCNAVLQEEPNETRALYRRGIARLAIKDAEGATRDLERCRSALKAAGSKEDAMASVMAVLVEAKHALQEQYQAEKELCERMFSR